MTRAREAARLIGNNTFRLDSNNAVGFNSTTPTAMIDINRGMTIAGILTAAGGISGSVTGAATQVTVADESSDATCFPLFVTAATGDLAPKSGTNLTFNSSNGTLETTNVTITGDLTVQGTTTTIDTDLIGVDKVEVGANNATVGLAVTQSGSGAIIAAYDAASEVFRVDDGGNTGIGTASPSQKLHVSGGQAIFDNGSNFFVNSAGSATVLDAKSGVLRFDMDGTEAARFDSSGRLAINNTTASSFTGNGSDNLVVGSGSGNEGITIYSGSSNTGALSFGDGTSGDAAYRGGVEYNHSTDKLQFRVGGTANRVTISDAGYIDAAGGAEFGGAVYITGDLTIADKIVHDGDTNTAIRFPAADTVTVETAGTERFRIDSRGSMLFSNGFMNETANINTTARTGTQDVDLDDGMVHYFSTNSSGNWTPNFTMSSGDDINATIATGDVFSPTMIVAKGNTSHHSTSIQVDGSAVTPEWLGGAPSDGGGSGTFDVYSYTIIKTGDDAFKAFAAVQTYE